MLQCPFGSKKKRQLKGKALTALCLHQYLIALSVKNEELTPMLFIHIGSRKVYIAGSTPNPNEQWMKQVARNVSMAEWGFLANCKFLLHDRDTKFCNAFRSIIKASGQGL